MGETRLERMQFRIMQVLTNERLSGSELDELRRLLDERRRD